MDEQVQHALEHDYLIDITTQGRKSGQPHRIEIRFHNIEGHVVYHGETTTATRLVCQPTDTS